jgi:hypothetical protein
VPARRGCSSINSLLAMQCPAPHQTISRCRSVEMLADLLDSRGWPEGTPEAFSAQPRHARPACLCLALAGAVVHYPQRVDRLTRAKTKTMTLGHGPLQ